ncbi:MAG TPA: two-component regulator propeller domain-containing protein [Mucilaginibacter sp.]|nr:two-component regulator propeller domain-containing protein [Mucilaginibacter sp.]
MRNLYTLICAIFILFFTPQIKAQYTSQQIDNSSGLSNSCINSIYQDADNIIWFGTWDGLNFYDGSTIHVFNYEQGDYKKSIASNVIYQVGGDKNRNIWISTVEGVSRFNKNTGDFTNYFYDPRKAVASGYTTAIDNNGEVYTAQTRSSEILHYDPRDDAFKKIKLAALGHFMLLKMLFDAQNNLWLLRDDGVLEAYKKTPQGFSRAAAFRAVNNVDNIFAANDRFFYTTRQGELIQVTSAFQTVKCARLPHEVRAMSFFKQHYIFAWASKGIGEYDDRFRPVETISPQVTVLQNERITTLLTDASNLLWLGTDGNGVLKLSKKEDYFGIVQKQPDGQQFHIPVRAFSEINSELWIGTKGNGIITVKDLGDRNMKFSAIRSFHTDVDLLDNCVYAIKKDLRGIVYIGSDAQGITLYDLRQRRFINWNEVENSASYPAFGSVHCVLLDDDGSVWLGLNESGLIHLKLDQKPGGRLSVAYLKRYAYTGGNGGPANNVIYTLAHGTHHTLWVGCRYGGLSLFNKRTGRFKTFKAHTYQGSLSNNDVLSLYVDSADRLWVGTSFGLNYTPEKTAVTVARPVFKVLSTGSGLPNNTIHAITSDDSNRIWISTNKGLACINPQDMKVVQYKEADGLQSDEFSDNAVWKDTKGMLYFGGIYGFNHFLPENIHISSEQPHLLIADLQFAGNSKPERDLRVLTRNGRVPSRHYELKPQDNYFELTLQPISYTSSQKCRYAYFLDGADKNWHYIGNHEKIIYNNIPPGDYSLKIKWSNGAGVWTPAAEAFSVTVKQYPWLTPPAFFLYGLMICCSAWYFVRTRRNKFLMAQELKVEHMLREKDEMLHQEQLDFFTNVAHELQTPLTLITGSVERYLQKVSLPVNAGHPTSFLHIVQQESARLHYLIHQLLDFRKAEAGQLHNHYSYIDGTTLLTDRASLFHVLKEQKQVDFTCDVDAGINFWTDKDKLEKIIFNLLSNAFKYCPEHQYIVFSAHKKDAKTLEIVVANSGCTLSPAEVSRLFDRFFVAENNPQQNISSGIGLAFTQQLTRLINGDIRVRCEDGWIDFKVTLPLNFVPPENRRSAELPEKQDSMSYIFSTLDLPGKDLINISAASSNKRSMIGSFENDGRKSVLIVEDEQLIRFLLRDILGELYIIYEAGSGKEALEVINRVMPDLIISDIMMPDMNGLQLCNLVKETSETCHIPFILLSARTTVQHMTEGYSCGADAYISKPFQAEHLLVRVQKLLEYREKLHRLFSSHGVPGTLGDLNESDRNFIEKVTRVIEDNLTEELDGAFLEDALNLSKIQLYRKIRTLSDMTPTELIRHVRLKEAAALLRNTDLTVSEIFYRTGFNNKTYFFREFKKMMACSPNDYRHKNRLPDMKDIPFGR